MATVVAVHRRIGQEVEQKRHRIDVGYDALVFYRQDAFDKQELKIGGG